MKYLSFPVMITMGLAPLLALASPTPMPAEEVFQPDLEGASSNMGVQSYWNLCESSNNSPSYGDAAWIANELKNRGPRCVQVNRNPGGCTGMLIRGNAKYELCGPYNNWWYCRDFAIWLEAMIRQCRGQPGGGSGRVGGQIYINGDGQQSGLRLRIVRS